jgi:hypothetical protein
MRGNEVKIRQPQKRACWRRLTIAVTRNKLLRMVEASVAQLPFNLQNISTSLRRLP